MFEMYCLCHILNRSYAYLTTVIYIYGLPIVRGRDQERLRAERQQRSDPERDDH